MSLTIQPSFDQIGLLYSVQDVDTSAVSLFRPGTVFPYFSSTLSRLSSAARPARFWILDCDVTILTSAGTPQTEGHKGDYLIELEHGELVIVRQDEIRCFYDVAGDVSRVYRTNLMDETVGFGDVAKIYDRYGNELQ